MTQKPQINRADYPHIVALPTRWMDNDSYGHVNNVLYYAFFDTAINHYLIMVGGLDIAHSNVIGLAVETHCQFLQPISFPDTVEVGLRVGKLGNSSVRYELGIFKRGEDQGVAVGYFVHVFVNRATRRPAPIPTQLRAALDQLRL